MADKWVAECAPCSETSLHDSEGEAIDAAELHVESTHRKTPAAERTAKRIGHVQFRTVPEEGAKPEPTPHPEPELPASPAEPAPELPGATPPPAPTAPKPPTPAKPAPEPPKRTTHVEIAKPSVTFTTRRK
jgi:hypothetical protein